MGMDPKQQRVLQEDEEPAPEDEPRDVSADAARGRAKPMAAAGAARRRDAPGARR
jgi:hypothetical protein